MKKFLSILSTLLLGSAFPLIAQTQSSTAKSSAATGYASADSTFMKKAAQGGLAEVQLGQLAVRKASSPKVKQFGQRMVDDHTQANDQLKQVAAQENVDLPQKPDMKDRATMARLEKLSGTRFDQAYMSDMVKDHQKDVADFQNESQNGKDPAVKSFAAKTLPTLQDHLQQAQQIAPTQQAKNTSTH
jgi:putative membrane protein